MSLTYTRVTGSSFSSSGTGTSAWPFRTFNSRWREYCLSVIGHLLLANECTNRSQNQCRSANGAAGGDDAGVHADEVEAAEKAGRLQFIPTFGGVPSKHAIRYLNPMLLVIDEGLDLPRDPRIVVSGRRMNQQDARMLWNGIQNPRR